MSVTFEKDLELAVATSPVVTAQAKSKGAKKVEEGDLDDDEVPAKKGATKKGVDDEDDIEDDDNSDVEDDDDWDPDFDEFDVPKSKRGKGGKEEEEEEDFKPEEDADLKELDPFSGGGGFDDEEDDDF